MRTNTRSINADLIVDLQFGSTGKGLIAGYLAKRRPYDTVVNANMPNAGHTFVDNTGRKWVHKVLPNGIVGGAVKTVMIGPGSVFNLDRLDDEMAKSADYMEGKRLIIHEDAVVLHQSHRESEIKELSGISSTMQGSAMALIEKMLRNNNKNNRAKNILNGHPEYKNCIVTNSEWLNIIYEATSILIEGAQGYSLGLNAGFWPYCTSRDCTPARFMADCGVPLPFLNKVIGTCRVHPIRVGNTKDGYSGDCYPDQNEINWEDIGIEPELTTVTKRPRRIFSFSVKQITEAILACRPDEIFLNFCNYDEELSSVIVEEIDNVLFKLHTYDILAPRVMYTGHGPTERDIKYVP